MRPALPATFLPGTVPLRTVALMGVLASSLALAVAHGSELWGGLNPCPLCLWERWPYRAAAVIGILAALLPPRQARPLLWLMVLALAAAAALGFTHAGVEFGWWPSPLPQCLAPRFSGGSIADRLASMPLRPSKSCEDPEFLIPDLPLSMASMNFLYAFALTALLALYSLPTGRRR